MSVGYVLRKSFPCQGVCLGRLSRSPFSRKEKYRGTNEPCIVSQYGSAKRGYLELVNLWPAKFATVRAVDLAIVRDIK